MSRRLNAVKEWINPAWVRHASLPPMEAGLRPNSLLDHANPLLADLEREPDDVLIADDSKVVFSAGHELCELSSGSVRTMADLGAPVGALVHHEDVVIASVDGRGLAAIDRDGKTTDLCDDPSLRCMTDLAVLPDGSLLAAVGSTQHSIDDWPRALIAGDRSGRLIRIVDGQAVVVASGLAWPSGVEAGDDGEVLVTLSLGHRIEARSLGALGQRGRPVLRNLPVYPGRIARCDEGWWIAAPYVRNRATELVLDEPQVCREMIETVHPKDWLVPRIRSDNPYTDCLQMGQLRVLGVLKPWAPPRSYGLAFLLGRDGRIAASAHSRVDGERHGITGVAAKGNRVVLAGRGCRSLLELRRDQ